MSKKVFALLLLMISIAYGQEGSSSPYSSYGIGLPRFRATVENASMGSIGVLADSIHLNLQNPASYGLLKLTAFGVAGSFTSNTIRNSQDFSVSRTAALDYIAVGIPANRFGFGFGLVHDTTVGYQNTTTSLSTEIQRTGKGGINRVFISAGVPLGQGISIGVGINYKFGQIESKTILRPNNDAFDTRDRNIATLSGLQFELGLHFQKKITQKLTLSSSLVSVPAHKLTSDNARTLSLITINSFGREIIFQQQELQPNAVTLTLPAKFQIGFALGELKKWQIATNYVYTDRQTFGDTLGSFPDNVNYTAASGFRLGGYYIPNYNSLTSYFKQIVFRAGFRYEVLGLELNRTNIDEFGISFGIGLPVGSFLSNANLGVEFGQRGSTTNGLVREDFFNFSIGISFNDKWFRKLKYN